ncbi:MAG: CPBP family intramembrane glutamic endopeptidase [Flavobacteriales bacterium]|jgi:membrane protease YdiL (CAAX protease family)|tara:strand:- start:5289 stop:6185 length:897 start_codon:yes stop_codon:yes gene_type:complete
MILKKFLSNNILSRQIITYLFITLVSFIVCTVLSIFLLPFFFDVEYSSLSIIVDHDYNQSVINALKFIQLFSCLGLFILPPFFYAYLSAENIFSNHKISRQVIILVVAIMILINPFVSFTFFLNQSIDIPKWLMFYDQNIYAITKAFLVMNSSVDLIVNLLVLAILPALGEELVFRGFLQKKIISFSKKPYLSIFFTALLFSVVHMQFEGVLPRFILGSVLGLMFYFSSNIWIPIIAHFINNALIVILSYPALNNKISFDLLNLEKFVRWDQAALSLIAVTVLFYLFIKKIDLEKKDI